VEEKPFTSSLYSWRHESVPVPVYISLVSFKLRPWGRWHLKEGSSWMQFSILTQKLFFGKHLKECVAITYFQWPEKSCKFFRKCPHYGASYAPRPVRLKEGSSWMQGTKIQHFNSKTLFLGKHLQECVAIAYFQLLVSRKHEKTA
jgi:hypothetical protein